VPNCCEPDSTGEKILDLFDENPTDCQVSLEEIKTSSLIASFLAPDVDMLDKDGLVNPRQDGVLDSLSLGVAFEAVPGTFTLPTP